MDTTRPKTRSPVALARKAVEIASRSLPDYACPSSRHDYTQSQLFALMVLGAFLKLDHRGIVAVVADWSDIQEAIGLKKVPHWSTLYKALAALVKKSRFDQLLDAILAQAKADGLLGDHEQASVDSTGLEAGGRSAHYAQRTGQKRYKLRRWPKLSLACCNATHLLAGILLSDGPSQDAPLLAPLLRETHRHVNIDCLLADAGYDSESNHAFARERIGIRSTVINVNRRGGRRWPKAKYRRQMYRRFAVAKYRQRAQIESVISRFKRNLSSILRGRSRRTQRIEVHLRAYS